MHATRPAHEPPAAVQPPADRRLADLRARADWTFEGRTLRGWAGELARGNDEALAALPRLGPALMPALIGRLEAAARELATVPPCDLSSPPADRPHPAAAARGRIALALGRLGPLAAPAVPALAEALEDRRLCESWEGQQLLVCARAAAALRSIGPEGAAALRRARGAQQVVARRGGRPLTLAQVASAGLDR